MGYMPGEWGNLPTCNLSIGLLSKLNEIRIEFSMAIGTDTDRGGWNLSLGRASGWDPKAAKAGGSGPGEQDPGREQNTDLGTYYGPEPSF